MNNSVPQNNRLWQEALDREAHDPFIEFEGFHFPTTTPVPDQLFDNFLHLLSGAELKVILYIIRRTFGFKKQADNISLNQMLDGIVKRDGTRLDWGTGLSKPTLLKALRSLKTKNLIVVERRSSEKKGDEASRYYLKFITTPVVKKVNQAPGKKTLPHNKQLTINRITTDVVVALTEQGIAPKTAEKLAGSYSRQRIENNISLLGHLQEINPQKVSKNPAGWLRRAIEEDYAGTSDVGAKSKPIPDLAQADIQAKIEMVATAPVPEPPDIWQEILGGLQHSLQAHFQHLKDSSLVEFANGLLVIQVASEGSRQWLENRLMHRILPQARQHAGENIEIKFIAESRESNYVD